MPNPGETLYTVSNGHLEWVVFVEESISPGASVPTWLVNSSVGRLSRCAVGMYATTAMEAWQRHLTEPRETLPHLLRQRYKLDKDIHDLVAQIEDVVPLTG